MLLKLLSVLKKAGLAVVILGGFVWFYNYLQATKPEVVANAPEEQIWTVTTTEAIRTDAAPTEQAFGTVRAGRHAELRFGVSGEVEFVSDSLRDGLMVKQGDILARLDSERLSLALTDISLQIEAEETQLKELDRQLELRNRTLARAKSMFSRNVATEADVDAAELNLSITTNQRDQSRARLAQLKVAKRNRQKDLDDSVLTSPFSGKLSAVNLALGNRVTNANMVGMLTDLSTLEVSFVVPADVYANLNELMGQAVNLSWQSGNRTVAAEQAVITRSEALVEKSEGGGRLFAELTEADASQIPPGAFVEISFVGRQLADVFELPEEALVGQDSVFVVEQGRAVQRQVLVRHRAPGRIWVDGELETGELVISTRLPGIGEGLAVRPLP